MVQRKRGRLAVNFKKPHAWALVEFVEFAVAAIINDLTRGGDDMPRAVPQRLNAQGQPVTHLIVWHWVEEICDPSEFGCHCIQT